MPAPDATDLQSLPGSNDFNLPRPIPNALKKVSLDLARLSKVVDVLSRHDGKDDVSLGAFSPTSRLLVGPANANDATDCASTLVVPTGDKSAPPKQPKIQLEVPSNPPSKYMSLSPRVNDNGPKQVQAELFGPTESLHYNDNGPKQVQAEQFRPTESLGYTTPSLERGSMQSAGAESAQGRSSVPSFDGDELESILKRHAIRNSGRVRLLRYEPFMGTTFFNTHGVEWLVKSPHFELGFGILIMINACVMAVQSQYEGFKLGYEQQFRGCSQPAAERWPHAEICFDALEMAFGIIFICEVVLKIIGLGFAFPKSYWNWFDLMIILAWVLEHVGAWGGGNPMILRMIRTGRCFRLLRLARTFALFDVLHLMVGSIMGSWTVMVWALIFLWLVMMCAAMVLNAILATHTTNAKNPKRDEVFQYFGTFSRTMVTMWEITLGNWVPVCRLLMDYVSEWFTLFFLVWQSVVGFCFLTVIRAVFIQETFKVAQCDEDLMILQKTRMMQKSKKQLHAFFVQGDFDGDGFITIEEFKRLSEDTRMKAWMAAMELNLSDIEMVFTMMDDGDGQLSIEELLRGFSRLKGPAQSVDLCHLTHMVTRLDQSLKLQAESGRSVRIPTVVPKACRNTKAS